MFKIDYNPCRKKYEDWFSRFSKEQQQKIIEVEANANITPKLIKLKRNKNAVEVKLGDVFLVSNREGIYFYGKVIQVVNTKHEKYSWSDKSFVAFIFKSITKDKNLDDFSPNYVDCVCGPKIFDSSYFDKGYLEIIGNIPLTKEEQKLDIGFFDGNKNGGIFIDSQGKTLDHFPKYYNSIGFITSWGISSNLSIAYITNLTMFEEK